MTSIDPVALAQALIKRPSVTPKDEGVLGVLEAALAPLGFACERMPFSEPGTLDVDNLYARRGKGRPHFCFAGHSDVVPVGDLNGWSIAPFAAEIHNGTLYGRGAADMKGAIAAFVAATDRFLSRRAPGFDGSISLLITGDEEGPSINGTKKMLARLAARGEAIDACVVGEPTSEKTLGDMVKIGRRGSMNVTVTVEGMQGHVGYPHLADNPIHTLVRMLGALTAAPIDSGNASFQPSSLQITTIDVGNIATNIIPARARARFNIRFNNLHSSATLEAWIRRTLDGVGGRYQLAIEVSGESFLTPEGRLSAITEGAIESVTGRKPEMSTTGGTSDARFITAHCPVLDFGLVGTSMHKIDERTPVADIVALSRIYEAMLDRFFATGG
ncbi:MAG: succinyl-diaminopimelate desuccinylase [Alphaproteobacteria bacterium]|nr:succinyl-diaminopimelate desuccinylase [Alphaproteobacteria bacterium]